VSDDGLCVVGEPRVAMSYSVFHDLVVKMNQEVEHTPHEDAGRRLEEIGGGALRNGYVAPRGNLRLDE
jgi:hypothetical protein